MTTYHSISLDILQNMIEPILAEILVESLLNEKVLRRNYGSIDNPSLINDEKDIANRMEIIDNKLVFKNIKPLLGGSSNNTNGTPSGTNGGSNGVGNGSGEYFQCLNCDRRIAGTRFAAHIDKCLGGRTRK